MSVSQEREEAKGHHKKSSPNTGGSKKYRPKSPVPSCGSMKSDHSMLGPPGSSSTLQNFKSKSRKDRPSSPVASGVSMKSDGSMIDGPNFSSKSAHSKAKSRKDRPSSPVASGVSMKSDGSMIDGPNFSSKSAHSKAKSKKHRTASPGPSSVSMKNEGSKIDRPNFSLEPQHRKNKSRKDRPSSPVASGVSMKSDGSMIDGPNFSSKSAHSKAKARPVCGRDDYVRSESPNREHTVTTPTSDDVLRRVIENHKASLKRKFENISEGIVKPGAEILLNKIYTELYITEGESEGVNKEHEVWQLESVFKSRPTEDTPVNCNDIFKPLPGQDRHIRSVMTKGIAGIGKTVSVQKFILDWIDGVANQAIDFIFPFPFRELNLIKGDGYSFHKLLLGFHPELKELGNDEIFKKCQILFVFDGLDESQLRLNFQQNIKLPDIKQTSSIDVLLTSLIQGILFPSALIWITSRPAAANLIPAWCIDQVTEVRGFNDTQKEEYFRKRTSDESQASKIIKHIKKNRSLHIMCHIPVFCWIAATVLLHVLENKTTKDIPKTLTEMFIHFLLIQTALKDQKYKGRYGIDRKKLLVSQKHIILKLAELAFKNLEQGNLIFYAEDLRQCGIDINEASVYSGMCTEIFKEESVFQHNKVYCFVHLTIQEFLAAVYVFHCFVSGKWRRIESFVSQEHIDASNPSMCFHLRLAFDRPHCPLFVLLKSAVDQALKSRNGHLDLFLRFLMGMSLKRNQRLLEDLLIVQSCAKSIRKTCQYIKELDQDLSPERCINLCHCLFEVMDLSMHVEIKEYLKPGNGYKYELSPAHCSTLAHMHLMSEEVLNEFDLQKYNTSDEGRSRLLPALRRCRKAQLADCELTVKSCMTLARVLQSENSVIHLDLSYNNLGDSGVQVLSEGLSSPRCILQTLRLVFCKLTHTSCVVMASLEQSLLSLIELDLSFNILGDYGVYVLFKGLAKPECKLQKIRIACCKLTQRSCKIVALVLDSLNSLTELDMSHNGLGDSGIKFLYEGLRSPHCKLQTLRLSECCISVKGYSCLAAALTLNPNHMRELDVSLNHHPEFGLQLLSIKLNDPGLKLKTLRCGNSLDSRTRQGLLRYICVLMVDPKTANRHLFLSRQNTVECVKKKHLYPDHRDRFYHWPQFLCRTALSERSYWEVDWNGEEVAIGVAYQAIQREGKNPAGLLGYNDVSWSLWCSPHGYTAWHMKKIADIPAPSSGSRRVGVYLDWPAGTLSFYSVSSDRLTHLHTFHHRFTQHLYPGFYVDLYSSVHFCQLLRGYLKKK